MIRVTNKADVGPGYVAECSDGSVVVFSRVITEGEGIYYTPYWEGNDAVTIHGYIHKVELL